jgi:hypothetical protein
MGVISLTTIVPGVPIGEGAKMGIYAADWTSVTSYTTGGEAIDLTADFDYIYAITIGGNDTLADNGYHPGSVFTHGTAITSSNVTLTLHWQKDPANAGGADIAFPEFAGDPHAIGQMMLTVYGN